MTVICVGVMVWEQLGLPKSQGRQCREERAWPGKDSAWKHKQSSRFLFRRRCCWTASLPLSHLINKQQPDLWPQLSCHSDAAAPPCLGTSVPSRAGNILGSPTADPQDFHRTRTRMLNLSKLLFCGKNCMQLPTLYASLCSLVSEGRRDGKFSPESQGSYLRSLFLQWAQEHCSHVC